MISDKKLAKSIFVELKTVTELSDSLPDLRVTVQDGIAIIEGYVDSYELKRKVQVAASRVEGLLAVLEELEVAEKLPVDAAWKPEEVAAWPFI